MDMSKLMIWGALAASSMYLAACGVWGYFGARGGVGVRTDCPRCLD
jgi:hypothetical protein